MRIIAYALATAGLLAAILVVLWGLLVVGQIWPG